MNPWTPQLETVVSVLNGGGIQNVNFPDGDPSRGKDLTLRARYSQGTVDAAVSLYDGRETIPLSGPDAEVDRTRFGGDAQLYYALPSLGGGSLRGEYYVGTNVNADSLTNLLVRNGDAILVAPGRDPAHLATDFQGGYVMLVQNLGEKFQVAGRYDWYDPNVDLDHDQFRRVCMAAHCFYDGSRASRSSTTFRPPRSKTGTVYQDPHDNSWTFQAQIKFWEDADHVHSNSDHAAGPTGRRRRAALGLAGAVLAAGAARRRRARITLKGSDTMVILAQRWAEDYMSGHAGEVIQVTGGGSGTGIAALINGTTDVCMASRPMKEDEKRKLRDRYQTMGVELPVARDGLTIYVSEQNAVEKLSLEQLRLIYTGAVDELEAGRRRRRPYHASTRARTAPAPTSTSRTTFCSARTTPRALRRCREPRQW